MSIAAAIALAVIASLPTFLHSPVAPEQINAAVRACLMAVVADEGQNAIVASGWNRTEISDAKGPMNLPVRTYARSAEDALILVLPDGDGIKMCTVTARIARRSKLSAFADHLLNDLRPDKVGRGGNKFVFVKDHVVTILSEAESAKGRYIRVSVALSDQGKP